MTVLFSGTSWHLGSIYLLFIASWLHFLFGDVISHRAVHSCLRHASAHLAFIDFVIHLLIFVFVTISHGSPRSVRFC